MRNKKILVWFRNDLRLHDQPALIEATQRAEEIVPVFIIDQRLFEKTEIGLSKAGAHRINFLLESITDLKKSIKGIGGDLYVGVGIPEEKVAELAITHGVQSVYYSQDVCSEEISQENKLQRVLSKAGIDWKIFWSSTLVDKNDLPFSINQLPDVFTKFRNKVERECNYAIPLDAPEEIISPEFDTDIPTLEQCGYELPDFDQRSAIKFVGGENAAISRVKEYLWEGDHIATYKETRNGLVGKNYSSKFSPWLCTGSISAKYIVDEIYAYEDERVKNDSTYWMIFELLWRDFFRFTAYKQGNKLFHVQGFSEHPDRKWRKDLRTLEKWIDGYTGDEFVDANMRELKASGWMSNRGRQNVASYLIHEMGVDWRWGAMYFEHALIDYDPASNWGNWAYLAGVGNDPRPDRKFNTQKQANDYDKNRAFRNLWLNPIAS